MSSEIAILVAVTLLSVISPGADFAMVTRNALVSSRKAGIFTAVGISAGALVHVAYAILGVGFIISQSILLFNALKIIGAAYLLWLGLTMVRSKAVTPDLQFDAKPVTDLGAFRLGFLTSVLNPETTLFVVSVYVQVIVPESSLAAKIGYGVFIAMAHFVWFALVAMFFSTNAIRLRLMAVRHWIDRVFGAILTALALALAYSTVGNRN